ncbi:unnamed protein product [Microthlaspi erraticum]|uniref:Uncharacterized protein n=1 Tax=Microthlaspi erraticum TaxID=1685480 RepID=A0A6D2IQQ6_9BRAS|nr:unnamed protein product [Microthlaspi erraticum]
MVSPLWSLVPAISGFSPPFPLSRCASVLRPASVEFAWVLVLLRFDLSPSELGVIWFGSFSPCRYLTSDRELIPRRGREVSSLCDRSLCDLSLATEGLYGEGEVSMKVLKKFEAGLGSALV